MGLFDILENKEFGDKLRALTEKVRTGAQELGQKTPEAWREQLQTLSEKAKTGVQELGQKAPAGMGGLVGAGILGAVLGTVLPKGAVKTAGLAGLGAVAWNFYQKWMDQQAAARQGAAQGSIAMDDPAAQLLIQAMVFAAKADGRIDASEQGRIAALLQHMYPGRDTSAMQQAWAEAAVDPAALAKNVQSQEQGEDVYRLSCLIIDVDVDAERRYLQDLALALGIGEQRRAALEREADAARQKLAAQG